MIGEHFTSFYILVTSVISAKLNHNLQEIISLNEHWKQDRDDLNVQIYNMREAQSSLGDNFRNLKDENDQLKRKILISFFLPLVFVILFWSIIT